MVSSEGLASVDPWLYRQGFNLDSWLLPDTFSHDSDLLARALHNTVSASAPPPPPHTRSPSSVFFDSAALSHPSSTHTLSSNISAGSHPDIVGGGAKRKRDCILNGSQGKATKRHSRASKKSQTTFISADPSNFRQMVQQVTGAKYIDDTSSVLFAPIVKPEPHRLVNRLTCVPSEKSTAVPTLDTSAFLSNHHQGSLVAGSTYSSAVGLPSTLKANAKVDASRSAAEFDTYPTFPTLESWKVV